MIILHLYQFYNTSLTYFQYILNQEYDTTYMHLVDSYIAVYLGQSIWKYKVP